MNTFLATIGFDNIGGLLFPLVIMAMGMCIPIIAIVTEHLEKKERLRLIDKAIEHGVDLKDLHLDDSKPGSRSNPRLPYRSGMILIAVGIALSAGHQFLDESFGTIHVPLLVGGLVTGLIGVAHLLNDWINRKQLGSGGK